MKPLRTVLLGLLITSAVAFPGKSQISPDGTTNTSVTPIDNGIRIDEGNRAGDNLFHSFQEFSVPNSSEAFFNNPNDILNIFSRVTGGNISNIDGLIRANGEANLFLINPAGIIFGENASLDLGGSFFSSTAESIVFSDEVQFSATDTNNPPLLTINQPIGLNFATNPGEIVVDGSNLQVNSGETFALFGGNITITGGQIIAPGANIELGGLTQAGQISFEQLEAISFPEAIARGDVTLTNGAEVDVRAAGGGSIGVNARNLELSGGELGESNLRAGIAAESSSIEVQAGDIALDATGNITLSQASRIDNIVEESVVGNAGGINITTNNLSLTEGSQINTSTLGQGNAGAVNINASDAISVDGEAPDGSPSAIYSIVTPTGVGDSGGMDITTSNLSVTQGGQVSASTLGQGNAGAVNINASDTISVDGEASDGSSSFIYSIVTPTGVGDSGGMDITTSNLSVTQGGLVSATTFGQGDAGNLTVTASESIELVGSSRAFPSGLFANTIEGNGNGGKLTIATDKLIVRDEAVITVGNFQELIEGSREPLPPGTGAAGNLEINAGSVEVSNQGKITADNANGIGGNLTLNADSLTIENQASISASTTADRGQGGILTLNIDDTLLMSNDSSISARADSGANGGNIDLNAELVVAFPNQNNDIIASAARGDGGNIDITTNSIFGLEERSSTPENNTNDIDASSEFGLDGTVAINELDVNPVEGLEELPTEVIDVTRLIAQSLCQQGDLSEFIVTGKGGIAPSPNQMREWEVSEVDLVEPAISRAGEAGGNRDSESVSPFVRTGEDGEDKEKIVEAQGWIVNDRGIVELVARQTSIHSSSLQSEATHPCSL
ncbi:MAG: filamentous hemagglutinin N-terminal domain-containing protein [Pleurocapsa sp. MO_226.B13]|nr:filamentous hemagglutinin N-terminal domain-containing protein [Pleurocapsa sp. MO_226.B13]